MKAFVPKDHTIQGFGAILMPRVWGYRSDAQAPAFCQDLALDTSMLSA